MTKKEALFQYILRLADTNLILGHRLSELTGHGPMLEEDIAYTNIALDLIGQANALLQYAAKVEGKGRTEDDLAFLRNEREFYNSLLSEQPNVDFAFTVARQFFSSVFEMYLYDALKNSADETLAALAARSHKEALYHVRHTTAWMERLGDGTDESHSRMQNAVDELWRFTADMFDADEVDALLLKEKIVSDLKDIRTNWDMVVTGTLERATLRKPDNAWQQRGSREGKHTEHLGFLLAEMQHLHRAIPGVKW